MKLHAPGDDISAARCAVSPRPRDDIGIGLGSAAVTSISILWRAVKYTNGYALAFAMAKENASAREREKGASRVRSG